MQQHGTSVSGMIVYVHSRIRPRRVVAVAGGVVHSRLRPRMVVVVVGGERRSKRQTDDRRCRGENLRHSESSLTRRLAYKAYVNLNAPFYPTCVRSPSISTRLALDPLDGHRIVEIGAVELINRSPRSCYFNPERGMPADAVAVHGLTAEFLADKPLFADVADELLAFVGDALYTTRPLTLRSMSS
jgi:Exonuclease